MTYGITVHYDVEGRILYSRRGGGNHGTVPHYCLGEDLSGKIPP